MTTTPKLNLDQLAGSIVRCFPSLNLLERRLSRQLRNLISTNWRAAPSMPRHLGHGRSGPRAAVISSRCVVGEAARLGFIANNPTVSGANSVTTGVSGSVNSAISRVDRAFVLYFERTTPARCLSAFQRFPAAYHADEAHRAGDARRHSSVHRVPLIASHSSN